MSDRRLLRAAVCTAVLLSAGLAQASQVQLLSKRHPSFDSSEVVGEASEAVLSADGRWAAFTSTSPNLVPGQSDGNRFPDVFLLDRLSGEVTLVSQAAGFPDTASASFSSSPSISADGRWIAFQSGSTNLVPGQTGFLHTYQVFLYDRVTGTMVLVSPAAGSATAGGNGGSTWPRVSDDGNFVTFMSTATNLVPGAADTNAKEDVFLWDRAAGTTALVSRSGAAAGTAANGRSLFPEISADGSHVLYGSEATDIIAGGTDSNLGIDVFLYDRAAGTNTLVSHAAGLPSTAGSSGAYSGSFSDDGAFAVFYSSATDLVPGQTGPAGNAFLFERATGTVTLVSHAPGSPTTAATASGVSISGDGTWVAFSSTAAGLIPGGTDTNDDTDVFLFERATGAVTLVSRQGGTTDTAGNGFSFGALLSQDGRYALFTSYATDLAPGQADSNGLQDVFLFDRVAGTSVLVSHADGSSSTAGDQGTSALALTPDGAFAAVLSESTDLTAGDDLNGGSDLFLYSRAAGTNAAASFSEPVVRTTPDGDSFALPAGDGRFLPLVSQGTDLVAGQSDANDGYDVFLVDRLLGTTTLVSHAAGLPETTGDKTSNAPRISADGSWMAFDSEAADLIPNIGTPPVGPDNNVFLYGREAGTLTLVSRSAADPSKRANGWSLRQEISGNGRYVAFTSNGTNLVTGQIDSFSGSGGDDVFLYDRVTGSMALASHLASDPLRAANGSGSNQFVGISFDGRFVLFGSLAGALVSGQSEGNAGNDLFLYDRDTGAVTLVSRAAGSATATANAPTSLIQGLPALSADGRYVAYTSAATNLVAGQADTNGAEDVFLFDRVAGTTTLLSRKSGTLATTGNGGCTFPAISDDGRRVAFSCRATDLVPGQVDLNQSFDAFLYDRTTNTVSLLSPDGVSTNPNAYAVATDISPDGRFVAIQSTDTLRIPGQADQNGSGEDVFVLDLLAGTARLATRSRISRQTTANAASSAGFLAGGGALVFFRSGASDFVEGDYNEENDLYVSSTGSTPATDFYTLTPCRVADTRAAGALGSGAVALFELHGACGIPATARAVALNVTAVQGSGAGHLTLFPGDAETPFASSVTFGAGQARASNAILPLAYDGSGTLAAVPAVPGGGTVHLILDVVGWFE